MSATRRFAFFLMRLAGWLMPDARAEWAEAMRSELHYVEQDRDAARWAFGYLLASVKERIKSMENLDQKTARKLNIRISILFALAMIVSSLIMSKKDAAIALCMLTAIWIVPYSYLAGACKRAGMPNSR